MKYKINYKRAFEQRCFQLIIDAYQIVLSEEIIQFTWNENDISQELYEKIELNRKRLNWNITPVREFYLTNDIKKEKGFADKLPRIDLMMSSISSKIEIRFYCEAKRIKESDSKLKRAYINEGMDRFILKKYPMGCMLGYLIEGSLNETIKGINSLLTKDKRETEILGLKQEKLLKSYYESNHFEIGILKHLIFDFTSNKSR
jgi:hypothetical protein